MPPSPPRFVVAAAQYPIEALADWGTYETKLSRWISDAVAGGAALAVFPEYGAMELASLDPATQGDLAGSLASVAALLPRVDALHRRLAREYGLYICAASAPYRHMDGHYTNRARIFAPSGNSSFQDKLVMTRFEAEQWGVAAGNGLALFETTLGRIGIAICYDSEFPLISRALAEAGCDLLLVPSCTDSLHGYWRVRLGCQARALEQQCHVIQSPTVGVAAWSPAVDVNRGAAGVYGPPDGDFPEDGVIAMGEEGRGQWLFAELYPARLARLRADGGVLNMRDWACQPGAGPLPGVRVEVLV